jgi:hypothetical protein
MEDAWFRDERVIMQLRYLYGEVGTPKFRAIGKQTTLALSVKVGKNDT